MHKRTHCFPCLMRVLSWAYSLTLLFWWLGNLLSLDSNILILSLDYVGVWLFTPLLVLLPYHLFYQHNLESLLIIIPLSLFMGFFGRLYLPAPAPGSSGQTISVLTHNLGYTNQNLDAIQGMLARHPVDVLAFQEVTPAFESFLRAQLLQVYPFHLFDAHTGLALFSKYDIQEMINPPSYELPVLGVHLQVGERRLLLLNAHFARVGVLEYLYTKDISAIPRLSMLRTGQISELEHLVRVGGLPTILACDCNMTQFTPTYRQITVSLRDAYLERGFGLGHTWLLPRGFEIDSRLNIPFQRIDYLFHSPEVAVISIDVIDLDTGSDHRALWGEFVWGQ